MKNQSVINMWNEFCKTNPAAPETYDAWAFGDSKESADELAELVFDGTKTATSSLHLLYELENEELPYVGLHNVILNGKEQAVGIIETTSIELVPFHEVSAEHAYLEGEGDRSLAYWRKVHEDFFARELKGIKREFEEDMLIVCERFKVVYR